MGTDLYCHYHILFADAMTETALLYLQLADKIAAAIQQGIIAPGSKLLSVRDCARQRKLSINTVTAAYRLLEDKGLIEARPKSGYFVRIQLPEPTQPLKPSRADERQADTPGRTHECLVFERYG